MNEVSGESEGIVERKRKILKEYLGSFFVKPILSSDQREKLDRFFSQDHLVFPVLVRSKAQFYQVVQYWLLRENRRLYYNTYNTYEFVQTFLNNEDVVSLTLPYPYIVVYHFGTEMVNKRLPDLTKQVLDIRQIKQLRTLFVSMVNDKSFGLPFEDIFSGGGIGGHLPTFEL